MLPPGPKTGIRCLPCEFSRGERHGLPFPLNLQHLKLLPQQGVHCRKLVAENFSLYCAFKCSPAAWGIVQDPIMPPPQAQVRFNIHFSASFESAIKFGPSVLLHVCLGETSMCVYVRMCVGGQKPSHLRYALNVFLAISCVFPSYL